MTGRLGVDDDCVHLVRLYRRVDYCRRGLAGVAGPPIDTRTSKPGVDDRLCARARRAGERGAARVFPSAVAEVGSSAAVSWTDAVGTLAFDDSGAGSCGDAVRSGVADQGHRDDDRRDAARRARCVGSRCARRAISSRNGEAPTANRLDVRDLLEHASGLPARLFDAPPATAREFAHEICSIPLEYPARTRSIYSDLGFILLGFIPRAARRVAAGRAVRQGLVVPRAHVSAGCRSRSAEPRPPDPWTTTRGAVVPLSGRCTTTTPRRLAGSLDMPGSSVPSRRLARSRERYSAPPGAARQSRRRSDTRA